MRTILSILLCLLLSSTAAAEVIEISSQLRLHFTVPQGWVSSREPPQFLIDEMAEHIEHDAESKGQHPTEEQLQNAARQRFVENEALLYNPQTFSFLTIDFSRLRQGERAPSANSIKLSARYAGESLGGEEGVSELSSRTSSTEVSGAWHAYRLDANYRHHDRPMAFIGIIGFASPYWFYFYFTDYLSDAQDRVAAEELLRSLRIESR